MAIPPETAVSVRLPSALQLTLNANRIRGIYNKKVIAAGYPQATNFEAYWLGIIADSPVAIIDLTTQNESRRLYYPQPNQTVTFGSVKIKHNGYRERAIVYAVSCGDKTIEVKRYRYNQWFDGDEPDMATLGFLTDLFDKLPGTVWIHCIAGVGRTGTMIAACILKEKISRGEIHPDNYRNEVVQVVSSLRQDRGRSAVNEIQFYALLE